ncbi:hypothetical protein T4B_5393 [Trichinella pseudospiralis]|uniref:Uncharacterized protein n=1 Tax=Trichinella pseudospiralis TaxID=6337 RepID=A0A0V1GP44_TRIPS|nr:hypothetical protein T4B_5393 [Trichinella pseudospiralis]
MNLAGFLYVAFHVVKCRNMEQPNYLSFEKPFITVRTLIIGKAMQCTASYHTFTQQNSFNVKMCKQKRNDIRHAIKLFTMSRLLCYNYLMLCYGCSEAFNYNSAHN